MSSPKISIVVPCYNQSQYLDEALESVYAQSFNEWECIIVNDGSSDNTVANAQQWVNKDARFKYISQDNLGLSHARNNGIKEARGEFILPLDADDKITEDYVNKALARFSKNKNLKIVYCEAAFFGEKSGQWHLKPYTFEALLSYNMIFCSAIFKKEEWTKVGGYDSNMKYGLEDWEFWINLLKTGGEVGKLNDTCFFYRVKSASMIKDMTAQHLSYSKDYVLNKHKEVYLKAYAFLLEENKRKDALLRSTKFSLNLLTKRFLGFRLFKDASAQTNQTTPD